MNGLFVAILSLTLLALLIWGTGRLQREDRQFLAVLPGRKNADGSWTGTNVTYYGFFNAVAVVAGSMVMIVLCGSVGIALTDTLFVLGAVLTLAVPASRIVARLVEGRKDTATVSGASFTGLLAAPWIVVVANTWGGRPETPLLPVLAAMTTSFAVGEGIGRMACISFGCCYGKPLDQCPTVLRRIFAGRCFVFRGAAKKAVYEGRLEGVEVLPVQALTAFVNVLTGIVATFLFLAGHVPAAFLAALLITQGWRITSEALRADDRGTRTFSAYQILSAVAIPYGALLTLLFRGESAVPEAAIGLAQLWQPAAILFLLAIGAGVFRYTGWSHVTGARVSFHLRRDRIRSSGAPNEADEFSFAGDATPADGCDRREGGTPA
ncbi:MAG TPA: prolipoprotein diacylglyceryl transferase [Syntrophales bacterium]|nr:prolipoprotein diacylglyceryl transferase [Syntrophales bacterium]